MNFVNDIKTVEMAQSYRLCTWQKSKRLLLPWFPAVIVPRLYFTRTQTNAILGNEHYIYPCWVRVDLYMAGDETRLQIFGSASAPLLYGCTPRGVSILRIPLVMGMFLLSWSNLVQCVDSLSLPRRCLSPPDTSKSAGTEDVKFYILLPSWSRS